MKTEDTQSHSRKHSFSIFYSYITVYLWDLTLWLCIKVLSYKIFCVSFSYATSFPIHWKGFWFNLITFWEEDLCIVQYNVYTSSILSYFRSLDNHSESLFSISIKFLWQKSVFGEEEKYKEGKAWKWNMNCDYLIEIIVCNTIPI